MARNVGVYAVLGSVLSIALQVPAGAAVSSGGQSLAPVILSKSHEGGFIRPPFNHRTCSVYESGVDEALGDGSVQSRDTVFTTEVPSLDAARALIVEASKGELVKKPNGHPDVGMSEYAGFIRAPRASQPATRILLKRQSLAGEENTSPAAAALVDFLDRNCP